MIIGYFVSNSRDGSHRTLKAALAARTGWNSVVRREGPKTTDSLERPSSSPAAGAGWLIEGQLPRWIWTVSDMEVDWTALSTSQCVNHFEKSGDISTKAGLCLTMRQVHWSIKFDVRTAFPRCYNLSDKSEIEAFKIDFHRSAAAAVLRTHLTLSSNISSEMPCAPKVLALAFRAVSSWIGELAHTEEGANVDDGLTTAEWEAVLQYATYLAEVADLVGKNVAVWTQGFDLLSSRLADNSHGLKSLWGCTPKDLKQLVSRQDISLSLKRLCALWPQARIDNLTDEGTFPGTFPRNTWIMKGSSFKDTIAHFLLGSKPLYCKQLHRRHGETASS